MSERVFEGAKHRYGKHLAAVVAAVLIGSLAACGGGGSGAQVASIDDSSPDTTTDSTATTAPTDPEEAALAFTKCMRDHGVDMPDPQRATAAPGGAKGGGPVIAVNGDPDDPSFQRAQEACEPLLAKAGGELDADPARQAEMKQQLLDFAQCMRDHGIDMPDPQFDSQGRVKIDMGTRPEQDDAAFQQANEACNQGGGFMVNAEPGSGETRRSASSSEDG
jgi:hypothetical protein